MRFSTLLFLAAACTGGTVVEKDSDPLAESDADSDSDSDADSDSDSDTDTAAGCASVTAGEDWAWDGQCSGMTTPCALVVDGCQVTVDYSGGMDMGMPTRGSIDGDSISFDGGGVTGCEGTVLDPDTIDGTCGDGCTFTLSR